ncbi:hypothetical protein V6N12_024086 [Hibiscus sabdariffa]|uniref:Uncharacterized protein n=1 Tax=Hibiscus sabdariffa TaxID=183260 RepID=A0ABR2FZJ9_9ROSI
MANPSELSPLIPTSIPPLNSTSIPSEGDLITDMVLHHVLERPASSLCEEQRVAKKKRGNLQNLSHMHGMDGVVVLDEDCIVDNNANKDTHAQPRHANLGPSDELVFGPWMIADTWRRCHRRDSRVVSSLNTNPNSAYGSWFTVLDGVEAEQRVASGCATWDS